MVCVPCFIIPVLLYIWHRFVQPIMLRYWNPWQKKDAQGNVIKAAPEFPFECKGGVCPYPGAKNRNKLDETKAADNEKFTEMNDRDTVNAVEIDVKKDN